MSRTEKLVTLNRLETILDAYGADPDHWPEEERAAALALLETSAEARDVLAEAQAVDGLLDRIEAPAVSPALMRRVHGYRMPSHRYRISRALAAIRSWFQPGPRLAWQSAVAAAAVIGIATGIGLSEIMDQPQSPVPTVDVTSVPADAVQQEAPVILVDNSSYDPGPVMTTSLGTNVTQISLTGEDGANSGPLVQSDDSGFAVASIPLY